MRSLLAAALVAATALAVPGAHAQSERKMVPFQATGVLNMPQTKRPMDVLGGRTVMFTFFATWSERSATAVPHLKSLHHALTVVNRVAHAVQFAHAANLIHGRITPSNVMIAPSGLISAGVTRPRPTCGKASSSAGCTRGSLPVPKRGTPCRP